MSSQRILGAVAAVVLLAAVQSPADAQYYSGSYSTFYQPYGAYYSGPTTAYYGSGYGYTSYYGGGYGYGGNPFAPLVPSPYGYGWRGLFGSGYTAAYAPYSYGGGCCSPCATGCSPCGTGCGYGCSTGGCATGNCDVPTNTEGMKASPDNGVPDSYDGTEGDRTFRDDEGFRRSDSGTDESGSGGTPGGFNNESFKVPTNPEGLELPDGTSPTENPIDADKPDESDISVPGVRLHAPTPRPISPRNSAQVPPATRLDQRITWRSQPVIVPHRQQVTDSRPLIVRKTVKVQLQPATTLVTQSNQDR